MHQLSDNYTYKLKILKSIKILIIKITKKYACLSMPNDVSVEFTFYSMLERKFF